MNSGVALSLLLLPMGSDAASRFLLITSAETRKNSPLRPTKRDSAGSQTCNGPTIVRHLQVKSDHLGPIATKHRHGTCNDGNGPGIAIESTSFIRYRPAYGGYRQHLIDNAFCSFDGHRDLAVAAGGFDGRRRTSWLTRLVAYRQSGDGHIRQGERLRGCLFPGGRVRTRFARSAFGRGGLLAGIRFGSRLADTLRPPCLSHPRDGGGRGHICRQPDERQESFDFALQGILQCGRGSPGELVG